jgi:predicted O-methyltransferase YrrM
MDLRKAVKQIPIAVKLYRAQRRVVRHVKNGLVFKRLVSTRHPLATTLKTVLENGQEMSTAEQEVIARIEVEREGLLNRNEPLIDGSLGEGGLYDAGVTIKHACEASKPPKPALMLYRLTRALNPLGVIELGTNVGISSAYIAAALKVNGRSGKAITLDASAYRQRLAREVHRSLGLDNISYVEGLFTDTLNETLSRMELIDLAFIDGHHQYQPTLDYFAQIHRAATPNAVLVFDDIRWSDGMRKAWSEIQADGRLSLVVDLVSVGLCVCRPEGVSERYVLPPLDVL